jgi:redox-sensitive bicupin YhaK (pirin superfamily)
MVDPHFAMLWEKDIPHVIAKDAHGRATEIDVVAGELDGRKAPPPPPRSWAARPDTDVAIWTIHMQPGATWTLPAAKGEDTVRTLYFFDGPSLTLGGERIDEHAALVVESDEALTLEAGDGNCAILMLQGRPIGEPVVAHGPFVMNDREGIQKAMMDYQRTRFGGWPYEHEAPVHAHHSGRFAKHADGRIEKIES